jgi:lysophospholipase L1-like esterase
VPDYWPADGRFPGRGQVSTWTGFRKHNADLRAWFAKSREESKDGLVFVGDSITEGWNSLPQDFADLGVKVVNRGIGGDTTPNLLYRLDGDVLSLHPRGVVLLIGTNDIGAHTPPADIAANLRDLHARLRAQYPEIPMAWCLVMPRGDGPESPQRIRELNAMIRDMAAADPHVTVVDTYTPLAGPDGKDNPALFQPDHLHLNAAGYAAWRQVLHPVVAGWKL